jgi:hypothetical protein
LKGPGDDRLVVPHRRALATVYGSDDTGATVEYIAMVQLLVSAFSVTQTISRGMKGSNMNNELERMWNKVVVT